ncbi:hypothetical protein F2Q70_00021468 [Brassica cretica]|uniref:Uncharacterized protein n=1 Tax=Brassica cretica TaxID=69181 RepID=A0A3N6RK24_BRACR|nr:hypothetical protein F2Q70_00021468 [Brassica cretica]
MHFSIAFAGFILLLTSVAAAFLLLPCCTFFRRLGLHPGSLCLPLTQDSAAD